MSVRLILLGLVLAFVAGIGFDHLLRTAPKAPAQVAVGHLRPQAEKDLTAQDTRPGAASVGRTVIQAKVRTGEPPLPPIPSASAPAWTTSWQLHLPQDGSCLNPSLHVATTLHLEGQTVVADSTGWADCNGKPLRIGNAEQVDGRTTLLLPPMPGPIWRAGVVYLPPQERLGKSFGAWATRDLGRLTVGGFDTFIGPNKQVGAFVGFSWGAR